MILKLDEDITTETVDKVVAMYNGQGQGEPHIIYLNSTGGNCTSTEVLLDIFDLFGRNTEIVGFGRICSTAFDLFFSAKCKKRLLDGTVGMYHQAVTKVEMNERWRLAYTEDEAKKPWMKNHMGSISSALCDKLGITEKDKRKIFKGDDVWFQPAQMQEFLIRSNQADG